MTETPEKKGGYIGQAWLVILLALLYGGALAGVQTTLGPRIALNKKNETYQRIPELVAGADQAKTQEMTVVGVDGKEQIVYKAIASDGAHQGWVLPARGFGFADSIDVLIGLDAELSQIQGIFVLDQKETPGLGNLIIEEDFRGGFAGKRTDRPLVVVKGDPTADNHIRAVTAATISSESVANIVNAAIANLKQPIQQLDSTSASTPAASTPATSTPADPPGNEGE